MSKPHKALELREIIHQICAQTESRADLACLARTSWRWFSSAIPILWDFPVGFDGLLRLIPGATIDEPIFKINEYFPTRFESSMLERLAIYAPWVTEIAAILKEALDGPSSAEQIHALQQILEYTSNHTLFCRLRTLRITVDSANISYLPGTPWLFLLVSPSITRLEISGDLMPVPAPKAPIHKRILQVLASLFLRSCLQLVHLTLNIQPRDLSLLESSTELTYSGLPSLSKLADITIMLHILDPTCVCWMATMPRLEIITIIAPGSLPGPIPSLAMHLPTSFDELRLIDARVWTFSSFAIIWRSPLVRALTEAILVFNYVSGNTIHKIGSLIVTHTPNLTSLSISLLGSCTEPLPIHLLQSLPLTRLVLRHFIRKWITPHGFSADLLELIGGYWPTLQVLVLGSCEITWRELLGVSLHLPHLKHFCIMLPFRPPIEGTDIPAHPLIRSWPSNPIHLSLYTDRHSEIYSSSELENLGLLLAMAWPNMTVDLPYPGSRSHIKLGSVEEAIKKHSALILSSPQSG